MQAALRKAEMIGVLDVRIGQIDAEKSVLLVDIRSQQERPNVPDAERQFRQEPRPFVVQPVFAHPKGMDIASAREHSKRFALLEYTSTIIG